MTARLKRYLKSFTLIELIIVIAIIAVLGATAFLLLTQWMSKGRDATKISTLRTIKTALDINYTSIGEYPIPQDAVEHTASNGTKLYQGYVGGNMVAELQRTPIDPTTKKPYIYSYMKPTGSVGYYQIGTTIENTVGYKGYELVKADIVQTAKIIGNYEFDPSLPSLIIVGGNETSKGIYDPSNCYVLDGGKNTVDGAQCEPKKDMPLKDYDNGLVGYWDMESLTDDGKLMDISGNGNHGTLNGTILTGSNLGKARLFNGVSDYINISNDSKLNFSGSFSLVATYNVLHYTGTQFNVFRKGTLTPYNINFYAPLVPTCSYYSTSLDWKSNIRAYSSPGFGNMVMVICVYNQDKKTHSIYFNGKKENQKENAGIPVNNNLDLQIGAKTYNYFNGIIDDIKLYNRALSDTEILQQAKIAGF